MNAVNYDKLMLKQIEEQTGKKKLLLHCCCAPCSSACLEKLKDWFDVTALFYNPNIEREEYIKRKSELLRFIEILGGVDVLDCDYDGEKFYECARGLENQKEGGKRCEACFKLRLEKTAQLAEYGGFDFFTTTLTISPLKNATVINKSGEDAARGKKVEWLYSDFKKRGGYQRSIQLSKLYNLYRQNYCGCVYSRQTLENK